MADTEPDRAATRLNQLLNMILDTAVTTVGFDAATVTTRHADQGFATVAATDQRLIGLDEVQYETGEGPCISVLDPRDPIFLQNAGEVGDEAWEEFARAAAHLGVDSSLSMHIPLDIEGVAASLNLYGRHQVDLGTQELQLAVGFAQQLAAAMQSLEANRATAKLAGDMAQAMRSRAVIEQARGILMADHQITEDEAFQRLVDLSQHANLKLRDVARRLVEARSKPADQSP